MVLKLELLQHTGSFKARGALNSVMVLDEGTRAVTAASGGNHGAAVAWAARRDGLRADVFVPGTATPEKLQRIRDYGATLHLVEGHVGEALEACRELSETHGVPLVHPYDTVETVCGAGTVGLEIAEQVPAAELVLLGCGGEGCTPVSPLPWTGRSRCSRSSPSSLRTCTPRWSGRPVGHGAAGAPPTRWARRGSAGSAYETAARHGTTSVLVDEESLLAARRFLWERVRVLAEPGASAALAALMSGRVAVHPGSTVVVVVSGGNNPTLPQSD